MRIKNSCPLKTWNKEGMLIENGSVDDDEDEDADDNCGDHRMAPSLFLGRSMVNDGTAASPPSPATTSTSALPLPVTTTSRHYFGASSSAEDHDFYIDIIENMQEDYGMFVWPCSIILAEYMWQQKLRFSSATVVELGAGTSLPGLVAAKVGADVILTDSSNRVEVLVNMRRICTLNKLKCKIMGLSWGEWDAPLFDLHPQIVLGADVLYDTTGTSIVIMWSQDFDNLFATVTFLLENSPGARSSSNRVLDGEVRIKMFETSVWLLFHSIVQSFFAAR